MSVCRTARPSAENGTGARHGVPTIRPEDAHLSWLHLEALARFRVERLEALSRRLDLGVMTWMSGFTRSFQSLIPLGLPLRTRNTIVEVYPTVRLLDAGHDSGSLEADLSAE